MIKHDESPIARGSANVENVYASLVARNRMTPGSKSSPMERYIGSTDYAALADVDLVVEAVFEDLEAEQAAFQELDWVCKPRGCWPQILPIWTLT